VKVLNVKALTSNACLDLVAVVVLDGITAVAAASLLNSPHPIAYHIRSNLHACKIASIIFSDFLCTSATAAYSLSLWDLVVKWRIPDIHVWPYIERL